MLEFHRDCLMILGMVYDNDWVYPTLLWFIDYVHILQPLAFVSWVLHSGKLLGRNFFYNRFSIEIDSPLHYHTLSLTTNILIGTSPVINASFSIAMFDYRRVKLHFPMIFLWICLFSHGFPMDFRCIPPPQLGAGTAGPTALPWGMAGPALRRPCADPAD